MKFVGVEKEEMDVMIEMEELVLVLLNFMSEEILRGVEFEVFLYINSDEGMIFFIKDNGLKVVFYVDIGI